MVAIDFSGGPVPWWIIPIAFVFAISLSVLQVFLNHRQRERKLKNKLLRPESVEDIKAATTVHPKFRTLYGSKPLVGVIVGLGIIVANVLFFSFVIPARTSEEIITTIALVIIGTGVAAFSNLIGLIRVSKARAKEQSRRHEI